MTNIIKLAVVGAGLVGQRHINAIQKQKDVNLVAIVEPNPTEDINSLDIPCFSNLNEMFAAISPDGVILSTPTPLHVSQGLECIEKSCPVLVEKPLATLPNLTTILAAGLLRYIESNADVPSYWPFHS